MIPVAVKDLFAVPGRLLLFLFLVGRDLCVGKPGVVIDRVVQVGVAWAPVRCGAGLVPVAGSPAGDPVSASVGDPA